MRRLVLTSAALLLLTTGIATVTTTPAQAGDATSQALSAGIYNETPFDLNWTHTGYSENGWTRYPDDVAPGSAALFGMKGSPPKSANEWCVDWTSTYNGWFTYEADLAAGVTEFITISIHGTRQEPSWMCGSRLYPALDVWRTSTAPPYTWRWTDGPPPNVVAKPLFTYQHNVPTLFDQTIRWVGEGPGSGVPTIVSLGDSTISGEGGRWAGNSNGNYLDDAGSTWYWDTPAGEEITDCHRSKSAEVHIGGGVKSKNLACSGAQTFSYDWEYPQGWRFKPGVDWCETLELGGACVANKRGQLYSLYHYAIHNNVKAVVLAVGANDFDFSGVLKKCITLYLETHLLGGGDFCYNSGAIQAAISDANRAKIEQDIFDSLKDLTRTMDLAGYDKRQYTVILQNYWSAIPNDEDIRIPDDDLRRMELGGCPILDPDATVLNETLLPAINESVFRVATRFRAEPGSPNLKFLDVSDALKGHRLCEKGVGLIEDIAGGTARGTDPTSADKVEWVTQARVNAQTPYTLAEGGHANYWGQLAERNCLRQLYNDIIGPGGFASGNPILNGARCVPASGGGVNGLKEPNMSLRLLADPYRW